MRLIALLIVVAIIYLVITRHGPMNSTEQAMKEADAVMGTPTPAMATQYPPTAQPAQPAASSSGLRAPLDRTRSVLGDVKKRNGAGEF